MTDFNGRVVLVTGGANGMGETTAHTFARARATVVIADFDTERSPLVEAEIRAAGGDCHPIITDIREPAQVSATAGEIAQRWGRVDVVHTNAASLELTTSGKDVLGSDEARLITGHIIPVDGGLSDSSPIAADYWDWLSSGSG